MASPDQEELWRLADERVRKSLPPGVRLVRTLRGHTDWIGRITWSPDGRMLASPSGDNTIRLWGAETGECLRVLKGHKNSVFSVAFHSAGSHLASGGLDGKVEVWNPASGELFLTLGCNGFVNGVAFDPASNTLASGCLGGTLKLWDMASGKLLRTMETHAGRVFCLAFDPAGRTLASGNDDGTVRLWDTASGKPLRTLEGHEGIVSSIAFNPAWSTLASGGVDSTIKLWDTASGKPLHILEGHTGPITCVAIQPEGRIVASRGSDAVRIWDTETAACVATLPSPGSNRWPPGLDFHPHLPLLATVSSDPDTPKDECDCVIQIYEYDLDLLLSQGAPTIAYTSAKLVLVGESNVGKSYLAHRIVTGGAPQEGTIKTTHGMRFWPLEPEQLSPLAAAPAGQRRNVVLWDMGGQQEYRLIHQLFLHDTTVALLLFDPTRGAREFKEVETWNKYLQKQLHGRTAVKLLVGAKLDEPSTTIDRQGIERLVQECGFAGYFETSALSGRGLDEFREAVARAIDWDGLNKTEQAGAFQRIRDEIEAGRKRGGVVLSYSDLHKAVGCEGRSGRVMAVHTVTEQLARQGVIALSRTASGEPVLVLQVQEIEHYAGSMILAARDNPRGVPALELRALVEDTVTLPGIPNDDRLPRQQEKPVLECTIQLMLEHGICFQHEGLLIFPSLFAPAPETDDAKLPHAVSLYYDFAGAIDNIYASLVAWLVLVRDFGRVRLWSDRAEFEVNNGGLCGLRKVGRAGGFAHVDVYFEAATPNHQREEFISFVEDHLTQNGVEIREHLKITCSCGHEFSEEILRKRITRGDRDVICPICETRHSLIEGAMQVRARDSEIRLLTWALRTKIDEQRDKITKQVINLLAKAEKAKPASRPIRLVHLSDLHFTGETPVQARLQWLLDDLKQDSGLGFKELDYLVISGDFTDKGGVEGFEKAYEFVSALTREFGLSAERCVFVPGNHDVCDLCEAYDWRDNLDGLEDGGWVKQGDIVLVRNVEKYLLRLKPFSDSFFHKFVQRPYPLSYAEQGIAIPFWETGLQFLALNSCWQIDQFHRKRAGLHVNAVASAIRQAQKQEQDARGSGQLAQDKPLLRIAVWHHAVAGPEMMKNTDFLGNLQRNGVRVALHGDVHEMKQDLVGYRHEKRIHVIGAGSFGARWLDRPESIPRLYNVLEIALDLKSTRVHTRCQPRADGPWDGWHEWPDPDGKGRVAYYDIRW